MTCTLPLILFDLPYWKFFCFWVLDSSAKFCKIIRILKISTLISEETFTKSSLFLHLESEEEVSFEQLDVEDPDPESEVEVELPDWLVE